MFLDYLICLIKIAITEPIVATITTIEVYAEISETISFLNLKSNKFIKLLNINGLN